jgi:putative ABC transport system ATP-binding protein
VVELRAVSKSFAGPVPRRIFSDVSLDVAAGEFVAIVGASGVGKSTLLNVIAGLERVDSGSVTVDGVDYATRDDDALTVLRRDRMGFVFQAFHVLPYLSVAENVGLPLALRGESTAAARERVAAMLDSVGLGGREHSRPRELSGGELQRVAIARALVHRPALVLADEPTGNLDPAIATHVIRLLREAVTANGAACVLATHSRSAAASADRIWRLTPDGLAAAQSGDVD